ncbi:hypothetical protein ABTM19_21165, partial [Acinetobacter baumannii]
LIILSNAAIGLAGFVELAWTIAKYEGLFLLVAALYLIARGFINEALDYFAVRMLRLRSGWILNEALLKPLSFWIQLCLLG